MALEEVYDVDWRSLINDEDSGRLSELRRVLQDPIFSAATPDIQELRAAIDHAPGVVENLLHIYRSHRTTLDRMMRAGGGRRSDDLLSMSPETIIHDFFRDHGNYFPELERAAEMLRKEEPCEPDEALFVLKWRLREKHGIKVKVYSVDDMQGALRIFDREAAELQLSEALDHQNRTFQLAHMMCLVEMQGALDALTSGSGVTSETGIARCHVELANYFAAAFLMPYRHIFETAERTRYDIDRLAAAFGVSFEQVCHRLTTLQRPGWEGVPFFFRQEIAMAQGFSETEGKYGDLHCPSAHACVQDGAGRARSRREGRRYRICRCGF